jgi:serine/threonine protein kinase
MKRRIGDERYELEQRLGHGGMATVYRAHDLKLERRVAIKLLADNFAGDEEVRKRFSREARLAARLDHPNVVQVFDVGEDDDRPYIVMEHVEGGTLADRLSRRRRSLDRSEALRLLGQLCEGLGHAHSKKLVHRDIKPQNLLLRASDDCLKITDFGIARAAEETTRLTRPGKVIGTDRYMAPEQLADGKITPATDVFACGVVAGELLPDARSPELKQIIERCLREDPDERFADARELGEALAIVDGNGAAGVVRRIKSQSRPTGPTKRLPKTGGATARWPAPTDVLPRDRRRWTRLGAALALIAAVAAGAVIALDSGGSDSPSKQKQARPTPAPAASVPRSDDPAQQARELADFLRAQSRPGQATAQP